MTTLFTKIIEGEIPAHKILEGDQFLAFLDIRPIKPGHSLVIPKKEVDYIFDLDDQLLSEILVFSKKVAKMIEKVIDCKRVGIMVAGLEVPHAHVHLVPMSSLGDLNFANAKEAKDEELKQIAEKIRSQGE
ncbi:MAG: HIT family protein [Candidatus Omnitrophica bacterium]|nr:HIT family protein [Candidatus Omnitrophota bacterium]